jgi:hypothetical protein
MAVLVGAHATAHSKELAAATSNAILQHRENIVDYQKRSSNRFLDVNRINKSELELLKMR